MNQIGHHEPGEIRENPEANGNPLDPAAFRDRQRSSKSPLCRCCRRNRM